MIKKTTDLGNIDISTDVIATICGGAATECYGVVGMASQKMMDGFYDLLGKDNYSKGIVVEEGQTGSIINLYVLEKTLDIDVEAVNVYVQSIRVMD